MKRNVHNKGFTLIELLVSIFVFSLAVAMSLTAVLTVLDANKKAQSLKSVMNNLNFALESMDRDLRFGSNYQCDVENTGPINCPVGGSGADNIKVKSDRDVNGTAPDPTTSDGNDFIEYRLKLNGTDLQGNLYQIERAVSNGPGNTMGPFIPITAPEIKIRSLRFYVSGATVGDAQQPRIFMTVQGYAGSKQTSRTSFSLQTSISQRCLDVAGGC